MRFRCRQLFPALCGVVLLTPACAPETQVTEVSPPAPETPPPPRSVERPVEPLVELADAEAQIRAAVVAVPPDRQAGAGVLAYAPTGELVRVRRAANEITCVADDPADDRFQVACYTDLLADYMRRGRELRAEGVSGPDNLARRHEEVEAGTLSMPEVPTTVYTFGGPAEIHDPETGEVDLEGGRRVIAIYYPHATEESTGLSTQPMSPGAPWIMRPGTPTAHVMVVLDGSK